MSVTWRIYAVLLLSSLLQLFDLSIQHEVVVSNLTRVESKLLLRAKRTGKSSQTEFLERKPESKFTIKHISQFDVNLLIGNPALLKYAIMVDHIAQQPSTVLFHDQQYVERVQGTRNRPVQELKYFETKGERYRKTQSKIKPDDYSNLLQDATRAAYEKDRDWNGMSYTEVKTTNRYDIYDIFYTFYRDPDRFEIRIQKVEKAKLIVGVKNGELDHFGRHVGGVPDDVSTTLTSIKQADFDKLLELRAKYSQDSGFRGDINELIKKKDKDGFLNKLKELKINCNPSRRKRSASIALCAFVPFKNDEVKKRKPKTNFDDDDTDALASKYKNGDESTKSDVIEEAKKRNSGSGDVELDNADATKRTALIQADDVNHHVKHAATIIDLQGSKKQGLSLETALEATSKLSKAKGKVKFSPSAIKRKFAAFAVSKGVQKFSGNVQKASKPLGYFFLAKGVINGIQNRDYVSLGIIAGKLLVDTSLGTLASRYASKSAKTLGKFGKAGKFLGKHAGPIGAVVDVGLSLYQLGTGIKALLDAKNQFDRTDAVITIVESSIDIAITVATTVLSIAFPPAAVIGIIANLLLNTFTAVARTPENQVDRIDSVVPLLGFEKEEQFRKHATAIFGKPREDYVDHLVAKKKANNAIVKQQLKVLKDYEWLAGIVFPSRTFKYHPCKLLERDWALFIPLPWDVIANECEDEDGSCKQTNEKCKTSVSTVVVATSERKCECDKIESAPNPDFGYAHRDSVVDFRSKKSVWHERAVPDDVKDADFICKPGHTSYQGYKVSQSSSQYGFYCENAIALRQTYHSKRSDQYILFALEDGTDEVYQDPNSAQPNFYQIQSGNKRFYGGEGIDVFALSGNCESLGGILDGGGGEQDLLQIESTCSTIIADFVDGKLSLGASGLSIRNIEQVSGRQGQPEVFILSPQVKFVDGRGGSATNPDIIRIPETDQSYAASINAVGYTSISSYARSGQITVITKDEDEDTCHITAYVKVWDSPWNNNIFYTKLQFPALEAKISFPSYENKIAVTPTSPTGRCKFSLEISRASTAPAPIPEVLIAFAENSGSESLLRLMYPLHESYAHHSLSKNIGGTRYGNQHVKNVFEILSGQWSITGGSQDDDFNLHPQAVPCSLNGNGGQNTLRFAKDFKYHFTKIDLDLPMKRGLRGKLELTNIQHIVLPHSTPAELTLSCTLASVYAPGGNSAHPQRIFVDAKNFRRLNFRSENCNQHLQIVCEGATTLRISDGQFLGTKVNVIIRGKENWQKDRSQINIAAEITPDIRFVLMLYNLDWSQDFPSIPVNAERSLQLKNPTEGIVNFSFRLSNDSSVEIVIPVFYRGHFLGGLVVGANDSEASLFHVVNAGKESGPSTHYGLTGIKNIFQVQNGKNSYIKCGYKDDVVLLDSQELGNLTVDGGGNSTTLIINTIPSQSEGPATVDLASGELFYDPSQKATVRNIGHIVGTEGLKDVIVVDTTTLTVAGRGGMDVDYDHVQIPDVPQKGRQYNIRIDVVKFTRITNSASQGIFSYTVHDANFCDIQLKPTTTNEHSLQFHEGSHIIENVQFDRQNLTMVLRLVSGKQHSFDFSTSIDGIYTNPSLLFSAGETYKFQIEPLVDGTVQATFRIYFYGNTVSGLPVSKNNFVLIGKSAYEETSDDEGNGCIVGASQAINKLFVTENVCRGEILIADLNHRNGSLKCLDPASNVSIDFVVQSLMDELQILIEVDGSFGNETEEEITTTIQSMEATELPNSNTIVDIKNINSIVGRPDSTDIVIPDCHTKSIASAEVIIIHGNSHCEGDYDLIMTIGPSTSVKFVGSYIEDDLIAVDGTFQYRLTTPRSFDVDNDDEAAGDHLYVLPFEIDDLSFINFDSGRDMLSYSVKVEGGSGTTSVFCEHSLFYLSPTSEFYSQPRFITKDGVQIQVSRLGAIVFTTGVRIDEESQGSMDHVVSRIQALATRLTVTVIVKLGEESIIYAGHSKTSADRNVLQNAIDQTSYLLGGGAENTLYEILNLQKDVFILPGFEHRKRANLETDDSKYTTVDKQTIDISSIVFQIREMEQTKYLPTIIQNGSDLIIEMRGYEVDFPGKLIIVNGTESTDRLQVLASASMMDLSFRNVQKANEANHLLGTRRRRSVADQNVSWVLSPRPIIVPRGFVYALSPEDLEIGQQLLTEDMAKYLVANTTETESENATNYETQQPAFQVTRNGYDLIFTNMKNVVNETISNSSANHPEMTTIIVTDFYNPNLGPDSWAVSKSNDSDKLNSSESVPLVDVEQDLLFTALDVQFILPGIQVMINGSKILAVNQSSMEEAQDANYTVIVEPTEWSDYIYETENIIYDVLPELSPRTKWERIMRWILLSPFTIPSVLLILVSLVSCYAWPRRSCLKVVVRHEPDYIMPKELMVELQNRIAQYRKEDENLEAESNML